jgi:site-specific recombinase XerD
VKRKLPQPLEPEELRAVLAKMNAKSPTGLRNRTMVALMGESGLRVGEVVNLRLPDLSRARDRIRVIDGKGGDRTVYLTETGTARLVKWLERRTDLGIRSQWIFPQIRSTVWRHPDKQRGSKTAGSKLSTSYVRALTARLGQKAGVARRTNPHAFRHTAATSMLEAGFDVSEVQATLGHRNVATTSVYLHVRNQRLAERMRRYQAEGVA